VLLSLLLVVKMLSFSIEEKKSKHIIKRVLLIGEWLYVSHMIAYIRYNVIT
jgi:hypothetical protein